MPTPILKIPVDDSAFRKFLDTFAKYQSQLGEQESAWAGINDALVEMTENLEQQKAAAEGLTEEEKRRAEALKRIAEQQAENDKKQAERDKENAKRREHAIAQVKEYARNVASAAMSLAKWASIDSAVALGTGMLSMWGLDKFASYAGDARKQAMGIGTSIGNVQRMGVGMSPYFDASATMDRVSNMQGDPTQWATFAMMGLNPRGKDPSDLTMAAADRARSMFQKDKGNLAIAQAQGLTNIFSPEELRRMAGESNKEWAEDKRMSRDQKANQGLSDQVARKWQHLMQILDNAGYHIENLFVTKLSALAGKGGPLENLEKAFISLVDKALTPVNINGIAAGLNKFAEYLNSDKFQKGFQTFIDDIVALAGKIDSALRLLGWVPDSTANQFVGDQAGKGGVHGMGRDTRPDGILGGFHKDDGTSFKMASNDQYQKVGKMLMGMGWSQNQARGILTNGVAESDLNPFAVGDNGAAYGMFQWHADRQAAYLKLFHHTMQSVKDRATATREQTMFADWELKHDIDGDAHKSVGDQIKGMNDVGQIAKAVSVGFEAAGGKSGDRYTEGYRRARAAAGAPNINVNVTSSTGHDVAVTANSAAGG